MGPFVDPVERGDAAQPECLGIRIQPPALLDGDEHRERPAVPLDHEAFARGRGVEDRPKAPAEVERRDYSHGLQS